MRSTSVHEEARRSARSRYVHNGPKGPAGVPNFTCGLRGFHHMVSIIAFGV